MPGDDTDFFFLQLPALLEQLCQRSFAAELSENIQILLILEVTLKYKHVLGRVGIPGHDGRIDFDLLLGFFPNAGLLQKFKTYDSGVENLTVFDVYFPHYVAFAEGVLAHHVLHSIIAKAFPQLLDQFLIIEVLNDQISFDRIFDLCRIGGLCFLFNFCLFLLCF